MIDELVAVDRIKRDLIGQIWHPTLDFLATPLIEVNSSTLANELINLVETINWDRAIYWLGLSEADNNVDLPFQVIDPILLLKYRNVQLRKATRGLAFLDSRQSAELLLELGSNALDAMDTVVLAAVLDGLLYSDRDDLVDFLQRIFHIFSVRNVNSESPDFKTKVEKEIALNASMCLSRFAKDEAVTYARDCIAGVYGTYIRGRAFDNLSRSFCGHRIFASDICRSAVLEQNHSGLIFQCLQRYVVNAIPLEPVPRRFFDREGTFSAVVNDLETYSKHSNLPLRIMAQLNLAMLVLTKPTVEVFDTFEKEPGWSSAVSEACIYGNLDVSDAPKSFLDLVIASRSSDPFASILLRAKLNDRDAQTQCKGHLESIFAQRENIYRHWLDGVETIAPEVRILVNNVVLQSALLNAINDDMIWDFVPTLHKHLPFCIRSLRFEIARTLNRIGALAKEQYLNGEIYREPSNIIRTEVS